MRAYLQFGKSGEPMQTVEVEPLFNGRNVMDRVRYSGKAHKVHGSGSVRVGWYIKVRGERVPVLVSHN